MLDDTINSLYKDTNNNNYISAFIEYANYLIKVFKRIGFGYKNLKRFRAIAIRRHNKTHCESA